MHIIYGHEYAYFFFTRMGQTLSKTYHRQQKLTFRYIGDVLSFSNLHRFDWIPLIYPQWLLHKRSNRNNFFCLLSWHFPQIWHQLSTFYQIFIPHTLIVIYERILRMNFIFNNSYGEFKDTKGEIRSRKLKKRKDNTMANRKKTKEQATIYKTLHRKLKIGQHEPY